MWCVNRHRVIVCRHIYTSQLLHKGQDHDKALSHLWISSVGALHIITETFTKRPLLFDPCHLIINSTCARHWLCVG